MAISSTLVDFTARPGDKPRDTPAVRELIEKLRQQHGDELVHDLIAMELTPVQLTERHALSRNELRRLRWLLFGLRFDQRYERWLGSTRTAAAVGQEFGLTPATVREHRRVLRAGADAPSTNEDDTQPAEPEGEADEPTLRVDMDGLDSGLISGVKSEAPITDWTDILLQLEVDPDEFYVVEDTVRMSKWQQSKRLENGERDLIWLRSYSARIKRKSLALTEDLDAARARTQQWTLPRRIPGTGLGAPVAAVTSRTCSYLSPKVAAWMRRSTGSMQGLKASSAGWTVSDTTETSTNS